MVGWRLPWSQGDPVVDQAVVPHLGGLSDDDAHPVVDDEAPSDLGPRVDLDPRPEAVPLGDEPGQEFPVVAVQPVGQAVIQGGVDSLIEQEDLQLAPGSRVPALIRLQSLVEVFEHEFLLTDIPRRETGDSPPRRNRAEKRKAPLIPRRA